MVNSTGNNQKILARILAKIRAGIDICALCSTSCQDICRQLNAERVTIYRFNDDWSGNFINDFGFAVAPWDTLAAFGGNSVWEDSYLQETQGGRYRTNESFAVADIYEAGYSACHIELLEQFQIRSYAISPIFVGLKLWGLLAAYKHSAPREWHSHEVNFLGQAASHIGIAIQMDRSREATKNSNTELQDAIARQRALTELVGNIRSSLDTQIILDTTCQEVCKLLKLERAAVYQFHEDWSGKFISDFGMVEPQWDRGNAFGGNPVWEDTYLQDTQGGRYRNNESFAVNDIYQAGHSRCHLDILEQYRIRAYALAPIFSGSQLWGLMSAYHHSGPRQWEDFEIEFLGQVGAQVGVAIQQAENLQQSQKQAIALQDAIARQRALTEIVRNIRSSVDTQIILDTICQELCKLLKLERAAVYQFNEDWSGKFISDFAMVELQGDRRNAFGENPVWEDTHLQETRGGRYRNNESFAVNDIYEVGHSRCHLDILEQYRIRAYALAPIFSGSQLWGLMAAYHHSGPRQWADFEIEFLGQVG
ncbi:MAG: GAF domain-containing protein, partial [Hormoscilla sp.]